MIKEEWDIEDDTSKGTIDITFKAKKMSDPLSKIPIKQSSEKTDSEMTSWDWILFREEQNIIVKGTNCPFPFWNWESLQIVDDLKHNLIKHYKNPTSIQSQAIPIGLDLKPSMCIAPTGCGKSCAFLTPLIDYV